MRIEGITVTVDWLNPLCESQPLKANIIKIVEAIRITKITLMSSVISDFMTEMIRFSC